MPPSIPTRVETATLAKFYLPGDPTVILKLLGVGSTAPFYLSDKLSRTFVLKWDSRAGGHTIRIPHSLWQANDARMAHDLMDQRRLPNAIIVTFELPAPISAPAPPDPVTTETAPTAIANSTPAGKTKTKAKNKDKVTAPLDTSASDHPSLSNKKGATAPSDKARIVVGPGPGRQSVAPTLSTTP